VGASSTQIGQWTYLASGSEDHTRYPKDFTYHVERQTFVNPATGNKVKFVSLPSGVQSKIYERWRNRYRKTPEQQLAPGIAKSMAPVQQSIMTEVGRRGTIYLDEVMERTKLNKQDALHHLTMMEQSGALYGDETEKGEEFWSPTDLGYQIAHQLRPLAKRAETLMDNIKDWTFVAFQDPRKRKFRHPGTGNWVMFDSLPAQEQMMLKQQLQLQQSQPQSQQPMIDDGGADMGGAGMGDAGMGDAGMGDAGMGGGDGGGGAMAMNQEEMTDRGEINTGEVEFGEVMSMGELEARMGELEARMGDYMGEEELEDVISQGGLGIVPVSLGAPGDPMGRTEPPMPGQGMHGQHVAEPSDLGDWTLLGEKEGAVERSFMAPVMQPDVSDVGPLVEEPPPPAQVRRELQERMRDLGRGLMVAGAKSPRMQMMEIQNALGGLLDQLEALSDQPGREALRRRILLSLRPRVMRF